MLILHYDVRGEGMDKKLEKKVNFNKGGTGSYTPRINLDMRWITDMGISQEENEVVLEYNEKEKKIIVTKK